MKISKSMTRPLSPLFLVLR